MPNYVWSHKILKGTVTIVKNDFCLKSSGEIRSRLVFIMQAIILPPAAFTEVSSVVFRVGFGHERKPRFVFSDAANLLANIL